MFDHDTTICLGLPCKARVVNYLRDEKGEVDSFEFFLLDSKGRRAPWMDKRASPMDLIRIRGEIAGDFKEKS